MISYRTVIAASFPEVVLDSDNNPVYVNGEQKFQNKIKYLPIDYQEDRNVTANSKIITQPLQNGDTMADHMYRDPVTLSIKGKFALNGRNWNNDSYSFITNTGDRLTSVQWVFEYLKNNGVLCSITTVATDMESSDYFRYVDTNDGTSNSSNIYSNANVSNTRFLTRDNMVLTSINWTEKQNVLEFNFSFTEVIMVDTLQYEVDQVDQDLPSLNEPRAQSVGTVLYSTGQLPQVIIENLHQNGYIENDFLRQCAMTFGDISIVLIAIASVAIAVGVIAATVTSTAASLALMGGAAAIFPVGTVVAVAAVAITAVAGCIAGLISRWKKERKQMKAFKLINGDPTEDYNRLCNLIDDIQCAIDTSGSNIQIYSFNTDEEQSICLPIGGNYYYLDFTKVNDYPYWKADIRINSDDASGSPITNRRTEWSPVSDFNEMNENVNMWFKDETKQYQVYLINPSLSDAVNLEEDAKKNVYQKLSSYTIWVVKGHVQEQIELINDAIDTALVEHDFD